MEYILGKWSKPLLFINSKITYKTNFNITTCVFPLLFASSDEYRLILLKLRFSPGAVNGMGGLGILLKFFELVLRFSILFIGAVNEIVLILLSLRMILIHYISSFREGNRRRIQLWNECAELDAVWKFLMKHPFRVVVFVFYAPSLKVLYV